MQTKNSKQTFQKEAIPEVFLLNSIIYCNPSLKFSKFSKFSGDFSHLL